MYLIEYRLIVGKNRHYAPTAQAAVRLLREIEAGGGSADRILRTSDNALIGMAELDRLALEEIGPPDNRPVNAAWALWRWISDKLG